MVRIAIKRVYDDFDPEDGYRVLVDRLWPRGVKKEALLCNSWNKDLAPAYSGRYPFTDSGDIRSLRL